MTMETFINLCRLDKKTLKKKLTNSLNKMYGNVINEDGYLYAEGNIPVMLEAHLDTVHPHRVENVSIKYDKSNTIISSSEGIGGDDRCGIYMILTLIERGFRPYILFTEDEEIGCIGARKFTKANIKPDIKYIIEFDRHGKDDCVFYDCYNDNFVDYVEKFGFKFNNGSCSDISYTAPYIGCAAVNLSCGYYFEHHIEEYVVFEEMNATINRAEKMLEDIGNVEKFIYIDKWDKWDSWDCESYNTTIVSLIDFNKGEYVVSSTGELIDDHMDDGMLAIGKDEKVYLVSWDAEIACKTPFKAYNPSGINLKFKTSRIDTFDVYVISENEYMTMV